MKFTKALTRGEMKNVTAGSGGCDGGGNIYCSYNGNQRPCDHLDTLSACTNWCIAAWGPYCGGCAQFPS